MIRKIMDIIRFLWRIKTTTECHISSKANIVGVYKLAYVTIDDYTYIASNSNISFTKIGKYCSIGPNLLCGWGIHPTNGISTSPMFYSKEKQNGFSVCQETKLDERKNVHIGNDVFIGANVTILDGITIGDGAVIGAGAVVSKNIPSYAVAVGCPIRVIRYRFSPEIVDALMIFQWWQYGESIHAEIESSFFDVSSFVEKFSS